MFSLKKNYYKLFFIDCMCTLLRIQELAHGLKIENSRNKCHAKISELTVVHVLRTETKFGVLAFKGLQMGFSYVL